MRTGDESDIANERDRDNSGGDSGCIVMIITVTRCGSDRSVV